MIGRLDKVTWQLDLTNSCWLDSSWELPQLETHLLVPAADLGVYVSLAAGRPVVTQVKKKYTQTNIFNLLFCVCSMIRLLTNGNPRDGIVKQSIMGARN
jgi:hypothetical protein